LRDYALKAGPRKGVGKRKRFFALGNAIEAMRQEDGGDKEMGASRLRAKVDPR
jgi:hypothetical protein